MTVDKDASFPNSMSVATEASFVVHLKTKEDILEIAALARQESLPLIPLGDGTNILPTAKLEAVVAVLGLKGIELDGDILKAQAGENWDQVVAFAVKNNLGGIEALSAIPGKIGAAPIQNIGAYGSDVSNVLEYVEAYDRKKEEFITLSKKECQFEYRDSLFKQNKDRFIVTSIQLKLSRETPKIPDYKDVKNYFAKRNITTPTLLEIREAIIEIRKNKLPDPKVVPNCGSFFKNPFVKKEVVKKLKKIFPNMPTFEQESKMKVPAGFLIEQAGFKGKKIGKIEIYKNNALVLTNPNHASFSDIMKAKDTIQKSVFQKFCIMLEPEVNIIV
ncbi:MAG: UDP-N-acetylmuramate dehydrogenase [Patescibacteria group bacterium]